jgi:hypothetical protein
VITPSLPTFRNASASTLPDVGVVIAGDHGDLLDLFLALLIHRRRHLSIDAVTAAMALLMPRASAIASAPAAIIFRPSRKSLPPSTVAVVVPSPATSFVLLAASFTSWATQILVRVVQLDILGDSHTIFGDLG